MAQTEDSTYGWHNFYLRRYRWVPEVRWRKCKLPDSVKREGRKKRKPVKGRYEQINRVETSTRLRRTPWKDAYETHVGPVPELYRVDVIKKKNIGFIYHPPSAEEDDKVIQEVTGTWSFRVGAALLLFGPGGGSVERRPFIPSVLRQRGDGVSHGPDSPLFGLLDLPEWSGAAIPRGAPSWRVSPPRPRRRAPALDLQEVEALGFASADMDGLVSQGEEDPVLARLVEPPGFASVSLPTFAAAPARVVSPLKASTAGVSSAPASSSSPAPLDC